MLAYLLPLLALTTAGAPADTPFVAQPGDAAEMIGRLVRLDSAFTATLTAKSGEVVVKDVLLLRRVGRPLPPLPAGPQLITANGDRVRGSILGGDGQRLRFRPAGLPSTDESWSIPLSSVSAVWLTDVPADTPTDPIRYPWVDGVRNRDVLRYRNGDTLRGTVLGATADADGVAGLSFRPESGGPQHVRLDELASVVFNPALARVRRPTKPTARLVLDDGSRIQVADPEVADGFLSGRTLYGVELRLPLAAVVSLQVVQGKATYLSDLEPKRIENRGFLGVTWPTGIDRTTEGEPLVLATEYGLTTLDKGIATRPRAVLTYETAGRFRRFEALIGPLPARSSGASQVRVRLDGKPHVIFSEAKPLTATTQPVAVRLDVTGVKELVLEVDFVTGGSGGLEVVWGDARLVE